ncbi:MAG: hypothetical protein K2J20_00510 [Bacilli bacterium]|nr:hypothetical protein [Bacilli bacterium]
MNIINPNSGSLETIIRPIDDQIIIGLAQIVFKCNKKTERYNLRDELYASKYSPKNLEQKELELEYFLKSFQQLNIRTANQNKEYKWIRINTENMGNISSRFYIAPDPNKMHEMIKKLVETFSAQNIPVRFKYQLTTGMGQCDRIIIYSDAYSKDKIENAIRRVYQDNFSLFIGCERSLAWLYGTSIPGVYSAPETLGDAYSNRLADAILEAKQAFNFLYGITNSNSEVTLDGKDAEQAIEYMKLLITSLMLRKGILLSKDGRCITIKDKNVKSCYDSETGILINSNMDERGYFEVKFFPTIEGRKALLENFYSVSNIQSQTGLAVRYLTPDQRREELNRFFYPYKYSQSNMGDNPPFGIPRH